MCLDTWVRRAKAILGVDLDLSPWAYRDSILLVPSFSLQRLPHSGPQPAVLL